MDTRISHCNKLQVLIQSREIWRRERRIVVWTNGCFDLLHAGHVKSLETARGLGDTLIVGLNSDQSVKEIKGNNRPIVTEAERACVLAALRCVDHVVLFDEPTPARVLNL